MSTAVIETLLQGVVTPRPSEPPPRPGDDRGAFKPALDYALRGDGPSASTICPPRLVDEPTDADDEPTGDDHALDQHGDAGAETVEADPADAPAGEGALAEDHRDEDAAEISDEASTAAAAALAAVIAEAGEKASTDAGAASQDGAAQVKALADAKQSGERMPEHPSPTNETGANLKTGETAPRPGAVEIGDVLPAKVRGAKETAANGAAVGDAKSSTRESSSKKTNTDHDNETSTENDESHATVVKVDVPTDDSDDSQSADAAGRDGRRSTGASRTADAPQVAAADGGAKSPTKAGEPAPVDPSAANGGAPPVAAASSPEPAAAHVAASIARPSTGRTLQDGASRRGDVDGTEQVDRARFVGRVEGAIRAAQQRDGRVHVRLSPPELGSLRMELTMHNGALSAHLEAETPAARNLLLDNLPALRDRLAQQDIRVERFDVDVRTGGGGSNQQQDAQDRPAGDPTAGQRDERRARAAARPAPLTHGPLGGAATNTNAALDVRV